MIDVFVKIDGGRELDAKLKAVEAAGQGRHPEMQKAWKRVGVMGLRDQRQGFLQRARSGWKRLGVIGVLLRRGSGPIASYQQAMSVSARLQPLRDTGVLFNSLTVGGRDHVLETGDNLVRFGTRVPYAGKHQKGGTYPLTLSNRQRKIVNDNLDFGKKGAWNPWAFQMRNVLKKKRNIKLPKREIISQDVARENMARYIGLLSAAVRKVLGK